MTDTKEIPSDVVDLLRGLESYRQTSGLRKSDLARKLGVSYKVLWTWMKGRNVPRSKNLRKVRAFLKKQSQGGNGKYLPAPTSSKEETTVNASATRRPDWTVIKPETIERVRERLGLTKTAMAERLQCTNASYHNWIKGKATPHLERQQRIQSILEELAAAKVTEVQQKSSEKPSQPETKHLPAPVKQEGTAHVSDPVAQVLQVYFQHGGQVDQDKLPALVAQIRKAMQ